MPHPNPNSQKALEKATKARVRPGRTRKIKIEEENELILRGLGSGSLTDGIDRLFAFLPVFSRAKAIIELSIEHLPPEKQQIAEAVLLELENLEIEQAYTEAQIEGDLPEPKFGAWII